MTAYGLDTSFLVAHEVSRHAFHRRVRGCCDKLLTRGDRLALAPQVLAEFIHVVTDERRFAVPLSVEAAVERASNWWRAEEVLPIYPSAEATRLFLSWMMHFRLGRKRLLDTLLAATWHEAGVTQILTLDWPHFQMYGRSPRSFPSEAARRGKSERPGMESAFRPRPSSVCCFCHCRYILKTF
jgi:predicted nucleic acid-binding protein